MRAWCASAEPAGAGLPVTYVSYTSPPLASIEPSRQRARAKQGWRYLELPVPHDVEIPNRRRSWTCWPASADRRPGAQIVVQSAPVQARTWTRPRPFSTVMRL
jgi:hypothetical protein